MNLRKLARGKACQVRIPAVCNHDRATTVLAHYRLAGLSGMGQKPDDRIGAWCCSACHDVLDGRVKTEHDRNAVRLMHCEGVMRTIHEIAEAKKRGEV